MRWAVTGGTGFIGRHLVAALRRDGIGCRVLTRGADVAGCEVVRGDIADRRAVEELVREADVVVHLAGYVHREARTAAQRAECMAANVDGTRNVVDALTAAHPSAVLIFVSTANVYGREFDGVDESAVPHPQTVYGLSKLRAEEIVLGSRVDATVLRPAMVFGEDGPGNLPRLVSLIRRGIALEVSGGRNRKSLVPVELLVSAIRAAARDRAEAAGRIFNVGGEALTIRRINELIATALGVTPRRIALPRAPVVAAASIADLVRPGIRQKVETFAATNVLDDHRLRALPSFHSAVDVEAALARTARALSVRTT